MDNTGLIGNGMEREIYCRHREKKLLYISCVAAATDKTLCVDIVAFWKMALFGKGHPFLLLIV